MSHADVLPARPGDRAPSFRDTGPLSSAHTGLKNVHASKRRAGSKYPNGTVIVKTIVKPRTSYVGQFAVMRQVGGRWRLIEY